MISCGHILFLQSISSWKVGGLVLSGPPSLGRDQTSSARSGFDDAAGSFMWYEPGSGVPLDEMCSASVWPA